jgi:hypothetical protein
METDVMKTLIAAVTLLLTALPALAGAPCQNPLTPSCQKACAVMGAKFVLAARPQSLLTPVQTVRANDTLDAGGAMDNARRLARLAGVSLDYIDGMTLQEINGAIAASCRR